MSSSPSTPFERRPLLVLALGGNALSPPTHDADDYDVERAIAARTCHLLQTLMSDGYRLLVVHGNGPQVGRLMKSEPENGNLDIHIAQTQGELGYLLTAGAQQNLVCLLTRVIVESDPGPPVKPIGPVLKSPPSDGKTAVRTAGGWRVVVPSPKPLQVVERDAITSLLHTHHVIAGGGGGVPMTGQGEPVNGVVDKDWVASLLAVELDAQHLVFATDVDHVYEHFEQPDARPLQRLTLDKARNMIASGNVTVGSMAPKVESAIAFVTATARPAHICAVPAIEAALNGDAGTLIVKGNP